MTAFAGIKDTANDGIALKKISLWIQILIGFHDCATRITSSQGN
jgi:hypothetical protein